VKRISELGTLAITNNLHSALINLVGNRRIQLFHGLVCPAIFFLAFTLQQPFTALYDVLPDGGSTSAQVEGELEVPITHVYSHEIADPIRAMSIVQNDPILSNRLQG
jgi:hypothetical protein